MANVTAEMEKKIIIKNIFSKIWNDQKQNSTLHSN